MERRQTRETHQPRRMAKFEHSRVQEMHACNGQAEIVHGVVLLLDPPEIGSLMCEHVCITGHAKQAALIAPREGGLCGRKSNGPKQKVMKDNDSTAQCAVHARELATCWL